MQILMFLRRMAVRAFGAAGWLAVGLGLTLSGCSTPSAGVGVGIPVGPFSIGVGMGSGGLSAGVGTGWGPVGAGVGVNQHGQVTGSAGVGASVPVGGAHVGAGIGSSTVLHTPSPAGAPAPAAGSAPPSGTVQWHDAQGHVVPACRVEGRC